MYVENKEEENNIGVFKSKIDLLEGLKINKIDKNVIVFYIIVKHEKYKF